MVCEENLSDQEKRRIQELPEPIGLETANGDVEATHQVEIHVVELDVDVNALLLPDVPSVLSMGRLCTENGFRHVWDGPTPFLQKKRGRKTPKIWSHVALNDPLITPAVANSTDQGTKESPEQDAKGDLPQQKGKEKPSAKVPAPDQKPAKKRKRKAKVKVQKLGEALSNQKHNCLTHFPKDPTGEICNAGKPQRAQCRKKTHGEPDDLPEPKAWADAITADHMVLNEDDKTRSDDQNALVIQDRYTNWIQSYPVTSKNAHETLKSFQRFLGPQTKAKHTYTDGSKEFEKALDEMSMSHDTSTPHRSQTNGVAERAVRRAKEGTTCALIQSEWNEEKWPEAMMCYHFLRNVTDLLANTGKTAYESRFQKAFKGPKIPFGAEVTYLPITEKDIKRLHKFGPKVLSGIFQGYEQQAGGGWSGDLIGNDWEEIENAQGFHVDFKPDAEEDDNEKLQYINPSGRLGSSTGESKT